MKKIILLFLTGLIFSTTIFSQSSGPGSRMNELFQITELTHPATTSPSAPNTRFFDPWEVTYGPDDSLWITESKNYKVWKISPKGGTPRMILNIAKGATFLPVADQPFDLQFTYSTINPQGGLAGLAIHPKFLDPVSPQPYVFISYIWKYISTAPSNAGIFFKNAIVRFHYNFVSGKLETPVMVCDTLPGSSDHNSQRLIIAPDNGKYYLFYANGDMGAGQFTNSARTENAQNLNSYEGKILRFNIDPDADAGTYDKWIPSGTGTDANPFNGTNGIIQSAVYALGIRNNQGFAFGNINGTDRLYGQSHGPFSDDEINIIERSANYGHPLVIGYAIDGNYDSAAAGNTANFVNVVNSTNTNTGALPWIKNEYANSLTLANYHDPIYAFYPAKKGNSSDPNHSATNTVQRMYYDFNTGNQGNGAWPSEAPSGLDIYTNSMIPGWKNSLLSAALKGGKVNRLHLTSNGSGVDTTIAHNIDTTSYFASVNRFRDIAISPDGLSIFTVIDSNSTTSGPTTTNPINSVCKGCLLKLTFIGYANKNSGTANSTSTLPDTITVSTGTPNACMSANTVNINSANNSVWVPITDANSNIIAEVNAQGINLGDVSTSVYVNSGTIREAGYDRNMYVDRNITITPTTQPNGSKQTRVRLYITQAEYLALKNGHNSKGAASGIATPSGIGIFKNHDVCGPTYSSAPTHFIDTVFTRTTAAGNTGYVLQTSVSSFSTFYFASSSATLPISLLSFTGSISNDIAWLQWVTDGETGTKSYTIERSTDGVNFDSVGNTPAKGIAVKSTYKFPDASINDLTTPSVFYRLKVIDADGNYKYSNIVNLPLPGIAGILNIHPNPVANILTVDVNEAANEQINWQILDNSGRVVMQGSMQLQKGVNTFNLNVGKLSRGIYFLKVSGPSINQGIKVQKM